MATLHIRHLVTMRIWISRSDNLPQGEFRGKVNKTIPFLCSPRIWLYLLTLHMTKLWQLLKCWTYYNFLENLWNYGDYFFRHFLPDIGLIIISFPAFSIFIYLFEKSPHKTPKIHNAGVFFQYNLRQKYICWMEYPLLLH